MAVPFAVVKETDVAVATGADNVKVTITDEVPPSPSVTVVSLTNTRGGAATNEAESLRARKVSNVLAVVRPKTPNAPSTTTALKLVLVISAPFNDTLTDVPRR